MVSAKDKIRFFDKVIVGNDCWEWQAGITQGKEGGYGMFWFNGTNVGAHRFSYSLYKGEIPKDKHVCHSCDNRKCVNPKHLWLGSRLENQKDMVEKGRSLKGTKQNNNKLTEEQVLSIYKDSRSLHAIARDYGVNASNVDHIKHGRSWGWLTKHYLAP